MHVCNHAVPFRRRTIRVQEKEDCKVAKYIIKRIIMAIITIFLVCFITFFAMNAVPGGPFNSEKAIILISVMKISNSEREEF